MKIVTLFFLLFFWSFTSWSQENPILVNIVSCDSEINTVGNNYITLYLTLDTSQVLINRLRHNNDVFKDLNRDLNAELVCPKYPSVVTPDINVTSSVSRENQLVFEITNLSDELIILFKDSIAGLYLKVQNDIRLEMINESGGKKQIKISKLEVEKFTKTQSFLTESMANELINAKGGIFNISQNKIDFGLIPSNESSSGKNEFNASFKIRKRYSFLDEVPIYFYTEGLLSTNSSDSLNYLMVYPINYNFLNKGNELVGQLGMEGDQTFSNYRISGNFYWNGIIPNLVDLTFGENRLRLKPVFKLGIKFYKEVGNTLVPMYAKNEFSNQIFGEIFYHIPVMNIYSIIIEGKAFYDFSSNINPEKNINYNFSAAVGIDIPKTDFKTIFKYTKGKNMVSMQSDDYLMVGLLVDLFKYN